MATDFEAEKKRRRDREPLTYCKWMVSKPGLWFGLTLGGHLLLMSINFILLAVGYDILPVEFHSFPLDIKTDTVHEREDAWYYRDNDDLKLFRFTIDDVGPTWARGYYTDIVTLYYTAGGKKQNVFQKKYFSQMRDIEDGIFLFPEYQMSFCQLKEDQTCKPPVSVLRYFDGTFSDISDIFYDPDYDNIPKVLHEAITHPATSDDFKYFLGEGYVLTPTEAFSNVTRSGFPLGWPLEGPENETEKHDIVRDFLRDDFTPVFEAAMDEPYDGLEFCYFSPLLFGIDILPQLAKDISLAAGSLVFIFIFMCVQTGSFWITGWAILSIITCFWITNLIYRTIINYAYFGYFHLVAVFIILGIGADDIFVFYGTWKATGLEEYKSLAHRLSDTYRRAAGTMFYTSFTTMMAFLVSGLSPLLPVGSFGIFTGVLVAVNYISVIVFFPNVILMHHLYFDHPCCCSCCCSETQSADEADHSFRSLDPGKAAGTHESDLSPHIWEKVESDTLKENEKNPVVVFFGGPYCWFVTHKVFRWIILTAFIGFLGFSIWSATFIEPSADELMVYRDNNNYGKAMHLAAHAFIPSGDDFVKLHLVWGLKPTDFSHCHFTDWDCEGIPSYDDVFDMNTPAAQKAIQDFCRKLKHEMTQTEIEELKIRNNTFTGELEVDCFMDNMQAFLKAEQEELENVHNVSLDLSYPLSQDNMEQYMAHKPRIYEPDKLGRQFYRYFEIGPSAWLSNGYSMLTTPDYIHYDRLVGEIIDDPFTQPAKFHDELTNGTGPFGYYGTKLRYAAIRVNLTLPSSGLGYVLGLPVMNRWEEFFQEQLDTMPAALGGGFPVTDFLWHWLIIQQTLERGAWIGLTIGIAIACVVLILATRNLIVGLQATLLIGCVTAGVLGVIPLAGWKIDVMISMNLTLLVGLSVDYIVHIAEGYHLSECTKRVDRIRDMLENLGISILNGAITTMGAAFFMLFAKITFFFHFGAFLFCIIGFSMAFSLMFFPAMMSIIGPEGDKGSIVTPFRKLHYKVIGRNPDDVKCEDCSGKGFVKTKETSDINMPGGTLDKEKAACQLGLDGPFNKDELSCSEENNYYSVDTMASVSRQNSSTLLDKELHICTDCITITRL